MVRLRSVRFTVKKMLLLIRHSGIGFIIPAFIFEMLGFIPQTKLASPAHRPLENNKAVFLVSVRVPPKASLFNSAKS